MASLCFSSEDLPLVRWANEDSPRTSRNIFLRFINVEFNIDVYFHILDLITIVIRYGIVNGA